MKCCVVKIVFDSEKVKKENSYFTLFLEYAAREKIYWNIFCIQSKWMNFELFGC